MSPFSCKFICRTRCIFWNSDCIYREEFGGVLNDLNVGLDGKSITQEETSALFNRFDEDGGGTIDYREMMERYNPRTTSYDSEILL